MKEKSWNFIWKIKFLRKKLFHNSTNLQIALSKFSCATWTTTFELKTQLAGTRICLRVKTVPKHKTSLITVLLTILTVNKSVFCELFRETKDIKRNDKVKFLQDFIFVVFSNRKMKPNCIKKAFKDNISASKIYDLIRQICFNSNFLSFLSLNAD